MPLAKHNTIHTREDLALHAAELFRHDVAVELGVHRGDYAKKILEVWDGKLFLVDNYREVGPDYPDMGLDGERKDHLWEVANGISRDEQCILIVAESEKAANLLKNGSVAFVYIDAEHTYEAVKRDIELWWPKVQQYGILAGHDYEPYHGGVEKAVDEFGEHRYMYQTSDSPPSWFTFKE